MSVLETLLGRLEGITQNGEQWQARCPAHADREPSLSITEGSDGRVLLQCFGGCETGDIVQALGLEMRDLFPPRPVPAQAQERVWEIKDVKGTVVALHHRLDKPNGGKQVWWTLPDGSPGLGGLKVRDLPLYGAHLLPDSSPKTPIVCAEGEKASDALTALGILAVGTVTGASATPGRLALSACAGHEVYLWPDADEAGTKHMTRVAQGLRSFGVEAKIVLWPGASYKDDAADFVAAGGTREELEKLLGTAISWSPPSENGRTSKIPEDGGEKLHLTDLGNGKRLTLDYGRDIRYCWPWRAWFVWTERRWATDVSGEIIRMAKETALSIYSEASLITVKAAEAAQGGDRQKADKLHARADDTWRHAKGSEAAAKIQAMVEMAKSEPEVPVGPAQLDGAPWSLNCRNGTVDLRTGELREHKREDLLTKLAPVNYDPDARYELWERFLREAIPDDDTRSYVQRCVGASLVGQADDDVLLVVHGVGGTGKGTFLGAIQASLGDYAASAELTTFTAARDAHAPQPDLARLKGRRLVAISEVENTPGGTVALLKRATGGDAIVTRSHFQESFEFTPEFTLWIICNDRPRIPHSDTGMWRRIREIPFTSKFSEPDPAIRVSLRDIEVAGPAVLAWAVQGCLHWQRQGLGELPKQIADATEAYREEMDPLKEFLEERTVEVDEVWTPGGDLWKEYQHWAKDAGIRYLVGRKAFSQYLANKYSERRRKSARGFVGVALATHHQGALPSTVEMQESQEARHDSDASQVSPTPTFPFISQENSSRKETIGNQTSPTVTSDTDSAYNEVSPPYVEQGDTSSNEASPEVSHGGSPEPWDEDPPL